MYKIADLIFLGLLGAASVIDIRKKEIPVILLLLMGGSVLLFKMIGAEETVESTLGGVLLGIFFFLVGKITREAVGYGDCFIILFLGIYKGGFKALQMILVASIATAMFSVGYCIWNGWQRKGTIPFVPFLSAAYVGVIFL